LLSIKHIEHAYGGYKLPFVPNFLVKKDGFSS